MADRINSVAVLGVGTMGSDISLLFALYDFDVMVYDISKEAINKLEEKHRSTLEELQKLGLVKNKEYETIREKITVANKLEDIKSVDYVLETVKEDLEVKRKLFKELDNLFPEEVVLATNTSSLRITDLAEGLNGADRVALMHFSNPAIQSPLAEIMKGEKTSEETLKTIAEVAKRIGKTPVILRKDMNGAVLNRVLLNVNNDALWALESKEVTQAELDATFRSIGWLYGVTGVLDLIGLDVALDVGMILAKAYGKRLSVKSPLPRMVKEGKLGKKSGKGFYDWTKGPPVIDKKLAGKYDVNRIFANAANESFWVIKDKMADPQTIDTITKLGFRSQKFGVCEIADSIGLDKLAEVLNGLYKKYGLEMYKLCPLFAEYLEKGWTGKAAGKGFYTYK